MWSHISKWNSWRKTCVNQDKIPPSKFRLIYEAIVKEKKNVSVGYYGFNLTIFSFLLSYDIFYIQPLIHIISYPPLFMFKFLFKKSFYLSHICNSHILEVLKIFLYVSMYVRTYLHGYRIARIIMVYKKNQNWG